VEWKRAMLCPGGVSLGYFPSQVPCFC